MRISKLLANTVAVSGTLMAFAQTALAEGGEKSAYGAIGAGLAIGIAALGGTLGQGKAVSSMLESSARNPGASGKLTVPFFVGLALIESLVILAFVIAIQQ
jgi:F-type H+-transporting ATPase subunit c